MAMRKMSSETLHTFLRSRRSIRRFRPDPVPAAVIERILATATHAPSAHNLQPWRFALVAETASRAQLGETLVTALRADMAAEGAPSAEIEARARRSLQRLNEAPVVVLLCRDLTAVRARKPQDEIMSIQSVANAATYLLLAAHAEGLGGNWICWPLYAQEAVQAALGLPEPWQPQALFFLGYADETPQEKALKPLEDIVMRI